MTDPPHFTPQRRRERAARDRRLAQALRDNLRRRKDQTRARTTQSTAPGADPAGEAALGDEPTA
jgi:hypothetical protein